MKNKISDKNTIILKCSCKHKAQDKMHGKNNRVHNKMEVDGYRYTVCGKERCLNG